jgi:signal transduction histidine kinase
MTPRTGARLAWGVWLALIMLVIAGMVLVTLNGPGGAIAENAGFAAVFLAMGTVGALVASRRPANPIGWILLGVSAGTAIGFVSDQYAVYALQTDPASLPGGEWAAWISGWIWLAALGPLVTFLLLLFPDGRLPSPRWRPVGWISGVFLGVAAVLTALSPELETQPPVANPIGIEGLRGVVLVAYAVGFPLFGAMILASGASLVVRYRRARGEERHQIKWFVFAAALLATWFVLTLAQELLNLPAIDDSLLGTVVTMAVIAGIPVAAGIAILKYRLYDIDIVIRKTVVFGALVAFSTLVYVAVVVGLGALIGGGGASPVLTIAAAAVIAVAFQPVRARARHLANRLVYGARATPYEVLSEFSDRVGASYAADDVLPRMARLVGEGTGATEAGVWLRVGAQLRATATWPPGRRRDEAVSLDGESLPRIRGVDRAYPVLHHGELLGALTVAKPPTDPPTREEEQLLSDLAAQAGLVLRNVRLIEELRASRQRLVTAQDEERRRLERNIHDGAQQQLVALAVKLRLAEKLTERDPAKARELVADARRESQEALGDLRDLARGIYPPLLADQGLAAALEAQARKAAIHVEVSSDGVGRYPQEAEAAVYFSVLEALQNAAKYAEASRVAVRLRHEKGELVFEVADDGRGFDPQVTRRGSGLQNMADRLDAIGGRIEVVAAPGRGTTVAGRIPLGEVAR